MGEKEKTVEEGIERGDQKESNHTDKILSYSAGQPLIICQLV